MAIFNLTPKQVDLLKACIEIGYEGAEDNHVDTGGENTADDLERIADLIAELDGISEFSNGAEITIMKD